MRRWAAVCGVLLAGVLFGTRESVRFHRDEAYASAAASGTVWEMRLLRFCGAPVNAWRALADAAAEGQVQSIEYLLASGVDVNERGKLGWTPLMFAAREGRTAAAAYLIRKGASVNVSGESGTALQLARERGAADVSRILESAGRLTSSKPPR